MEILLYFDSWVRSTTDVEVISVVETCKVVDGL